MLILRMARGSGPADTIASFDSRVGSIPSRFRPLIQPTIGTQAGILGLSAIELRRERKPAMAYDPDIGRHPLRAEVFTDGNALYIVSVLQPELQRRPFRERGGTPRVPLEFTIATYYAGPDLEAPALTVFNQAVSAAFGVELSPFHFSSPRFEALREGRECPSSPTSTELDGALVLRDRAARTLAIAIKASGGLLVRDLSKQLPADSRDRVDDVRKALQDGGLIDSEIVVVCTKNQAQTARAPSRDVLASLEGTGLKCACGRALTAERIEEALTITATGRDLLEKSRWLTIMVLRELRAVGVQPQDTLVEQHEGGDELDVLAVISGELVFFELKDKEFNLGSAYSFGAKIGIIQPEHPVIVSTEHVGNDAKEHFQKARSARTSRSGDYTQGGTNEPEIRYIEGISNLSSGIADISSDIHRRDAMRALQDALALVVIQPGPLMRAIESRSLTQVPERERPLLCEAPPLPASIGIKPIADA